MLTKDSAPDKIYIKELMGMIPFILFTFSPSFSYLWGVMINLIYLVRTDKVDRAFDTIIKDVEEPEEDEDMDEFISVAVIEDRAYWVVDNTFYVAEIVDGEIDKTSSRPINAFEMSIKDINKMLFILDNLVEG